MCQHPDCKERAWYGDPWQRPEVPQACNMHRCPVMAKKSGHFCEVGVALGQTTTFLAGKGEGDAPKHRENGIIDICSMCDRRSRAALLGHLLNGAQVRRPHAAQPIKWKE